jgi:hypothetical protein
MVQTELEYLIKKVIEGTRNNVMETRSGDAGRGLGMENVGGPL